MKYCEDDLVSVIVPVYNVAQYLERCVNSILRQTYKKLEIILIDDGSTDASPRICDELGIMDERIKVIHQSNQGLSGARNTGIDNSQGDYLCFVDSDDFVHPDYVRYLYKMCRKNNCEIAICYHYITSESNCKFDIDLDGPVKVFSRKELFDVFYTDMHGSIVIAWNKLYKRECIGDIRYDVGKIHEDEGTTFKFLYNAHKIAFTSQVLYYYFDREESITGLPYSKKKLDILDAYENRLAFYKEHSEKKLYDRECQYYLSEILANYYKVSQLLNDRDLLGVLRDKYLNVYNASDRNCWSKGRRALYFVCKICPLLYGNIKHVTK